jgi:hypothetical protein
MKDVSDILAKRLLRLESPFSRDWLSDFSNLMEFIQINPLTTQVLESIREKKEEAHASLIHHLKAITQDDANVFVSEYCLLSCIKLQEVVHLNIDLIFSPHLQKCKQDIEILAGQRKNSMWGKWDLLLKWADWTKNGISPGNQAFERNLSNLFKGLNISMSVQNCGLFFIERLASMKTVITDCEICLKALELYLDAKEQ